MLKKIFGLDKVFDVVDKVVTDKDEKNKLLFELQKIEIESNVKLNELINARMGTLLEKCISLVFPIIGFVFAAYLISNLVMHIILFWRGETTELLVIDKELFQVIMIYLTGFFGKGAIKTWKGGENAKDNK